MGIPGPNDPASAYPAASSDQLAAQAPATAPADDIYLLDIRDAHDNQLLGFQPWFDSETNAVNGADLTLTLPEIPANLDLGVAADYAVIAANLPDAGTAQLNVQANEAQVSAGYGSSGATLDAHADGAGLRVTLPVGAVGYNSGALQVTRNGFPQFQVFGNGDVRIYSQGAGVILTAPNGTGYRISVANDGTLSTAEVALGDEGTVGT